MSGNVFIGGMCDYCGGPKHFGTCKATAKEPLDGSPLESVVQGRSESPARSGDADVLAELRARATAETERTWQALKSNESKGDHPWACYYDGKRDGYLNVLKWLDELAQPNEDTAPDTKSGSAGVPEHYESRSSRA